MRFNNENKDQDWHRADIRAELEKRGTSLRKLSREAGLSENTLRNALDRKWPKGEKLLLRRSVLSLKKFGQLAIKNSVANLL